MTDAEDHPVTIRRLCASDLPAVVAMIGALSMHHGDVARTQPELLARDALGPAPWCRILVAETEGSVLVGYAALVPILSLHYATRGMDLHHLYVLPEFRGRRLGRRLVEAAIELARADGAVRMTVGTAPGNDVAGAIYRSLGFEPLPWVGCRYGRVLDAAV